MKKQKKMHKINEKDHVFRIPIQKKETTTRVVWVMKCPMCNEVAEERLKRDELPRFTYCKNKECKY